MWRGAGSRSNENFCRRDIRVVVVCHLKQCSRWHSRAYSHRYRNTRWHRHDGRMYFFLSSNISSDHSWRRRQLITHCCVRAPPTMSWSFQMRTMTTQPSQNLTESILSHTRHSEPIFSATPRITDKIGQAGLHGRTPPVFLRVRSHNRVYSGGANT